MSDILSDLFVGMVLLIAGSISSYILIHSYQKGKDVKEIRERLITFQTEATRKFWVIIKYWQGGFHTTNPEQKAKSQDAIHTASIDFDSPMKMLFGRLLVYFEHTNTEKELYTKIDTQCNKTIDLMIESFQEDPRIVDLGKKIPDEIEKVSDCLAELFDHIINAKPK